MSKMTETYDERMAAIKERCELATPEPWRINEDTPTTEIANGAAVTVCDWDNRGRSEPPNVNDRQFIANARQDIPWLLVELDKLEEENKKLRGLLTDG